MVAQLLGYVRQTTIKFVTNTMLPVVALVLTVAAGPNSALASPLTQHTDQDDVVIELMQTGVGNTSDVVEDVLVFRVRAFDLDEGDDPGDGIAFVDMIVLDEDGDEVHRKRETSPDYCAFGGGAPNCEEWDFEENDDSWPSGEPLDEGEHTLRARVRTDDGNTVIEDFDVEIFLSDDSDEDAVIELMQTGVGNTSDVVEDVLVFRVRAFDPDEGNDDGDGIDYVEMFIFDENGDRVHYRRENNPGYCAFGGGAPNCEEWDFEENDESWPNGQPLDEGEHTLRALVHTDDGDTVMEDFDVEIFLSN